MCIRSRTGTSWRARRQSRWRSWRIYPTSEPLSCLSEAVGSRGGIGTALKQKRPAIRVIGVEPTGAANMALSRKLGRATDLDVVETIADGLATKKTDPEVFAVVNEVVDDFVTVTDDEIRAAILFLLERAKLLAETGGAAAAAALLSGKVRLDSGTKIVALVCGR